MSKADRRDWAVFILVVLTIVAALAWVSRAEAADFDVAPGGTCTGGGSHGAVTYSSIATAVAAAGAGDTIVLHNGTIASSGVTLNVVNLTVNVAAGDTATVDGSATSSSAFNVTATGVTLDGFTIDDYATNGRKGIVDVNSTGFTASNMTITGMLNPDEEFATACFWFDNVAGFLVEDSSCSGDFAAAVHYFGGTSDDGIIRNNTFTGTVDGGASGACKGIVIKQTHEVTGDIAIYNNVFDFTGNTTADGSMLYTREIAGTQNIYMWANVCTGTCGASNRGTIYTQENSAYEVGGGNGDCPDGLGGNPYSDGRMDCWTPDPIFFFNNTVETTAAQQGIAWQEYASPIQVINNIFDGHDFGYEEKTSADENCTHAWCTANASDLARSASDTFSYNVVENCGGSGCGSSAGTGSVGTSPTETGNSLSTGAVTSAYRDASENLTQSVGVATNDPLGQGADDCELTILGEVIDCSLDINGDDRATTWDVGADQYEIAGGTPTGACCTAGVCAEVEQASCTGAGVYQGDSTLCAAISCSVPGVKGGTAAGATIK